MEYLDRYGKWAGDPYGQPPDLTRCAASVPIYLSPSPRFKQCAYRAKYDRDSSDRPTACRYHCRRPKQLRVGRPK